MAINNERKVAKQENLNDNKGKLISKTPNMLYCNIAYMKYYQGINGDDKPYNGGRYIGDTGNVGEKYNLLPFGDEHMYGFFEPGFTKGGYEDGKT